jgi:hypothetical protein
MQSRRMNEYINHLFFHFFFVRRTANISNNLYLSHVDGKLSAPALKVQDHVAALVSVRYVAGWLLVLMVFVSFLERSKLYPNVGSVFQTRQ